LGPGCLPDRGAGSWALFAGQAFSLAELRQLTEAALRHFDHPPRWLRSVQLDERLWLLELFHGRPGFKDLRAAADRAAVRRVLRAPAA